MQNFERYVFVVLKVFVYQWTFPQMPLLIRLTVCVLF